MEQKLARFYELKQLQKEIETELESIRQQILELYPDAYTLESGGYKLSISFQERREYDENKLYNSLPDPSIWRLMSKADAGKISSLVKLNVISEGVLEGTYEVRSVPYVRVQKL